MNRREIFQKLALLSTGLATSPLLGLRSGPDQINTQSAPPVYLQAGTGKKGKIGINDIEFKFDKSHTRGQMGSAETILYPGVMGAPPHFHQGIDEVCRVLEGTLTILVENQIYSVSSGDWHLRPKGQMHCFWNSSSIPVKFIEIYLPAGHEAYMQDLAALFAINDRPDPSELAGLAEKHDITFVWNRLEEIEKKYGVKL